MKNLILVPVVLIILLFSSASSAEWTRLDISVSGGVFYVDFDRIRKRDGHVYYWNMLDDMKGQYNSVISYTQGDCQTFRSRTLQATGYSQNMGRGTVTNDPSKYNWKYPNPNTADEGILKSVCEYAKRR